MDKNTLKGLLLMGAVIFLFMYLSKPKVDPNRQAASAQSEAAAESTATVIDSIKPGEAVIVYAADYIRQAGVKTDNPDNPELPVYTYADDNVLLTLDGGVVDGVVKIDTLNLSYADVVASNFPDVMTVEQKSRAASSLRQALVNADKYKAFSRHRSAVADDDEPVVLENDQLHLEFSRRGGYISKAVLPGYYTYFPEEDNKNVVDTAAVVMFSPEANAYYDFTIRTVEQQIKTRELTFTPEHVNDSTLLMKLDLGNGAMWGIRYTLPREGKDNYAVRMEIVQQNMQSIIPPSTVTMGFDWNLKMPREERGRTFEERNSGIYYKYVGDRPDNINGAKTATEELRQNVKWIGFKNQFFSTVIIPRKNFEGTTVRQTVLKDHDYLKLMAASAHFGYDVNSEVAASFDIFIGPNLYPLLKKIDKQISPDDSLDLTRLIPLGWSWLRWINTLIVIPVFTFLSGFISSYGIIILLLTIFIKLILFPFTYKSYMSQAKMRVLAPEIKEINDKYPGKENAMVRQQKTMALYSRAGASPFSGCLPLLLQMPILIAMFSFFPSCIELRGESFLWAHDLAAPDVILNLPFSIPFYGDHVSLFCLLMTVTNIIYTKINMQNQPSQASMPGMKWMMYLMPLMFLFFFNDYAAALSYYYFLSLLITIIQTYIFRRCVNEKKLRQRMMENAAKPKKKSGFMARLEEAQRKQQAMLREQQKNRRR